MIDGVICSLGSWYDDCILSRVRLFCCLACNCRKLCQYIFVFIVLESRICWRELRHCIALLLCVCSCRDCQRSFLDSQRSRNICHVEVWYRALLGNNFIGSYRRCSGSITGEFWCSSECTSFSCILEYWVFITIFTCCIFNFNDNRVCLYDYQFSCCIGYFVVFRFRTIDYHRVFTRVCYLVRITTHGG